MLLLLFSKITQATVLLRWLLMHPEQGLQRGPLTEELMKAGILNEEFCWDPQLSKRLEFIEHPDVVEYFPPDSKEFLLGKLLSGLKPGEAEGFIAVLKDAADTMSDRPKSRGMTKMPKWPHTRGAALFQVFEAEGTALDSEWLRNCSHHAPPTERIVWPLKKDLFSPAMINALPERDENRQKLLRYRALADPTSPEALALELGASPSSIPAEKAWLSKNGGVPPPILPAQLILHVGVHSLRLALFSSAKIGTTKRGCLEIFSRTALPRPWPKGFTISGPPEAKTFNAAIRLKDPSKCSDEDIFKFTQEAWMRLRSWITDIHNR